MTPKPVDSDELVIEIVEAISESSLALDEACERFPHLAHRIRKHLQAIQKLESELDVWLPVRLETKQSPTEFCLPGYDLFELVGQGGMGTVYKARQMSLNRTVAIKTLHSASMATLRERDRLVREAEAVASIDHPNVVKVFEVGESQGIPYFTMEYVPGPTLEARLSLGPLHPQLAATLVRQLARAVQSAHQQGVLHRDIKPSNVLMNEAGEAKLSDFGLARLAKHTDALTETGAAIGTPRYMSPEQARGNSKCIGVESDIYSLGAVLFATLTSRPPFLAESNAELLSQVLYTDPISPSAIVRKIPRELSAITLHCLRKLPNERYASAAALADDLDRFLEGRATLAKPDTPLSYFTRIIRKHPIRSLGAFAFFLAALLIVIMQVQLAFERSSLHSQKQAEHARVIARGEALLNESFVALEAGRWHEAERQIANATALVSPIESQLEEKFLAASRWAKLGNELETVRLNALNVANEQLDLTKAHDSYLGLFRSMGIDELRGEKTQFIEEIQASPISLTLIGALDHWSTCAPDEAEVQWLAELAMASDTRTREWRLTARKPSVFNDPVELDRVLNTAPTSNSAIPYLMSIEVRKSCTEEDRLRFLKAVQRYAPHDFWINLRLANVLMFYGKTQEAIGYYRAAEAVRSDAAIVQNNLAVGLSTLNHYDDSIAHFRQAIALEPSMDSIRVRLLETLSQAGRHAQLLEELPFLLERFPADARLRTLGGISQEATGKVGDAIRAHASAQVLEPFNPVVNREYRNCLIRDNQHAEAAEVWEKALGSEFRHADCYGLAELNLFLGNRRVYELQRDDLLSRFGGSTDAYEAERVARACLLLPCSLEDLRAIELLAQHATELDRQAAGGTYPHFQFVKGLLLYRQGKNREAEEILVGDAAMVLKPVPSFIRAMIAVERQELDEGRELFDEAVASYDWSQSNARNQDAWIRHIFRREAEAFIRVQ